MPTNVTPEYRRAEQAFREAREPRERLDGLKEMLRTIPKHKGTEHLQADLKRRVKALTEELSGGKKSGRRSGPAVTVRPEGAAQVCLVGPPNSGKSSLHRRWTGSQADVGPYPFTTHAPLPGMLNHGDVQFQLVDLPPLSAEYMEPWWPNAVQPADAALLVLDLADPACVDQVAEIRGRLAEKKIILLEHWPALAGQEEELPSAETDDEIGDPFRIELPTLLLANKSDLVPDPEELEVLQELSGTSFPAVAASAETGQGQDEVGRLLLQGLEIVRAYTKIPGKDAENDRPFTVRRGGTVLEVAFLVHKDIANNLRFARVWGSATFDGQQVGPDHVVHDLDVIELHVR